MNNRFNFLLQSFGYLGLFLSMACSQSAQKNDSSLDSDSINTNVAYQEPASYQYVKDKDTVSLIIQPAPQDSVIGTLVYKIFEKDTNEGTVKGKFFGDTLLLNYTFQSEGITSEREVAFLRNHGKLLEGYGPVKEQDNKVLFASLQEIEFGKGVILTNTRP